MADETQSDNHGLTKAVKAAGNATELARRLGITKQAVSHWVRGRSRISPERAIAIERATEGEVSRADLRPDLWGDNHA